MSPKNDDKTKTSDMRSLTIAEWPVADAKAWSQALKPRGVLDDASVAASWRAITQRAVAKAYGHWLAFLDRHGWLEPAIAPDARVTHERVQAFVDDLRARGLASATIHMRVLQLSRFLEAIKAGSSPPWLMDFINRLKSAVVPTRDDRAKLVPAETLLALGFGLIERAEQASSTTMLRRAGTYRDGLMILIFCACPLRVGNLVALEIARSFVHEGDCWWAIFPEGKTKTSRLPIALPLPQEYAPLIARYIEVWRPILLAGDGSQPKPADDTGFLWLNGRFGSPLQKVADRIAAVMQRELGRSFNVHLFRKVVPTELAIRDPEHVGVAQALLGHARYDTTEKAYNLARSLDAARRVQATLLGLRHADTKSIRRAR